MQEPVTTRHLSVKPLFEALAELARRGLSTPCQREPEQFTSDSPKERAEAAEACQMCPVLDACRTHAETFPEVWNVWGGADRTTTGGKK